MSKFESLPEPCPDARLAPATSGVEPSGLERSILTQAKHLQALRSGWDGYAGDPPNPGALAFVVGAVLLADPPSTPDLVPGGDGSVQAEWHLHEIDFEFWVGPNAEATAVLEAPRGAADVYFEGDDALTALFTVAPRLRASADAERSEVTATGGR